MQHEAHLKRILYRHFSFGCHFCGDLNLRGLNLYLISSVRHPVRKTIVRTIIGVCVVEVEFANF